MNPEDFYNRKLVLSLFPGADLLGRGFESEGFCVVRARRDGLNRSQRRPRHFCRSDSGPEFLRAFFFPFPI
jgi:hypothetical protein